MSKPPDVRRRLRLGDAARKARVFRTWLHGARTYIPERQWKVLNAALEDVRRGHDVDLIELVTATYASYKTRNES